MDALASIRRASKCLIVVNAFMVRHHVFVVLRAVRMQRRFAVNVAIEGIADLDTDWEIPRQ
jgi:hypothetical protein